MHAQLRSIRTPLNGLPSPPRSLALALQPIAVEQVGRGILVAYEDGAIGFYERKGVGGPSSPRTETPRIEPSKVPTWDYWGGYSLRADKRLPPLPGRHRWNLTLVRQAHPRNPVIVRALRGIARFRELAAALTDDGVSVLEAVPSTATTAVPGSGQIKLSDPIPGP